MYVTERAVFNLSGTELVLVETALGIDIDKDILEKIDFQPQMDKEIKEMDKRLVDRSAMKIKGDLETLKICIPKIDYLIGSLVNSND